jgi:hypothetical protein
VSILVPIAMFGWIPVVLMLFALLPARRAVIVAMLFAWLFLPQAAYKVEGLPPYDKMTATCAGLILGAVIFDARRLLSFWPGWVDLPMAVWCLCPFISSLSNDLGAYDGLSAVFRQSVVWGLPYLIGRLYFNDLRGIGELAVGLVVGGLVYIPLCLLEIRISPQLHRILYGFAQNSFVVHVRYGGYRPMVFMPHGLIVAFWMGICAMMCFWLWMSGTLKRLWGMPMLLWLAALAFTLVLCKAMGPLLLFVLGCAVLMATKWRWGKVAVVLLALVPAGYVTLRVTHVISTEQLLSLFSFADADRLQSFEFRLKNEDMLLERAMQRPLVGWAGWGRARVFDENGTDLSVTDGLWIIVIGNYGLLGVSAIVVAYALPVLLLMRRYRWKVFAHPEAAPLVAFAVVLCLAGINNLPNADSNPVFMAVMGGLAAIGMKATSEAVREVAMRLPQSRTLVGIR